MSKYHGKIGYGREAETAPGVYEMQFVERSYFGDVIRNARRIEDGEGLNENINVDNSFSIMGDAYAYEHFFDMKYIHWMGALWTINSVEVKRPRLVIRVRGLYNGPTA